MIEAVENHNPEVIVIDEIGRELEAAAARTIAERGVQLIGTAHGNTLENLLLNPTLSDLVGGIECVTLSDEEARRRGTQKTVLERRAPPTFDVLIEIQTRDRLAVHHDVAAAVDALLRGYPLPPEIRSRDEDGEIRIERAPQPPERVLHPAGVSGVPAAERRLPWATGARRDARAETASGDAAWRHAALARSARRASPCVARHALADHAHLCLRRGPQPPEPGCQAPECAGGDGQRRRTRPMCWSPCARTTASASAPSSTPRTAACPSTCCAPTPSTRCSSSWATCSTSRQMSPDENRRRLCPRGDQAAIDAVLNGERWVELQPAASSMRRLQHQMARQANLLSHSYGKEPRRRVRIFRE